MKHDDHRVAFGVVVLFRQAFPGPSLGTRGDLQVTRISRIRDDSYARGLRVVEPKLIGDFFVDFVIVDAEAIA